MQMLWQEFNIEKMQLFEAEKKKIKQEYERKSKQAEARRKMWVFLQKKIINFLMIILIMNFEMFCNGSEYSMQLNAARIKFLQAQDDAVNAMKEAASKELLNVSNDKNKYRTVLKGLIVQVIITLIKVLL